jgi:hypothetical protein
MTLRAVAGGTGSSSGGVGAISTPTSVMYLGDSISTTGQQNAVVTLDGGAWSVTFPALTNISPASSWIAAVSNQWSCPAGAGTLAWTAANQSLKWKTNGDTYGPELVITRTGIFRLESGTAGGALILSLLNRPSVFPVTDVTDAVTPGTSIFQFPSSGGASFIGWIELLLNCPFETSLNYAISGATAVECLEMAPQWESVYTDISSFHIGTNASNTIAIVNAELVAIKALILKRQRIGSKVVLWTLLPNNGRSTQHSEAVTYFNLQLRQIGIDYKLDVVDAWAYLGNPDTSVSYSTTPLLLSGDGVHPSYLGAYIMAKRSGIKAFSKYVSQCLVRPPTAVAFSATSPSGNLLTNPTLTGTTGTKGTGVTGDVPTGWNVFRVTGTPTAVCVSTDGGTVPRTDTGQGHWFQMNFDNTGGAAGNSIVMKMTVNLAGAMIPAPGDTIVLQGEVQLKATSVGFSGFNISVTGAQGGPSAIYMASSTTAGLGALDGDTIYMPFTSRPFKVPVGMTIFNVSISTYFLADATVTVNVGQTLTLHKV